MRVWWDNLLWDNYGLLGTPARWLWGLRLWPRNWGKRLFCVLVGHTAREDCIRCDTVREVKG